MTVKKDPNCSCAEARAHLEAFLDHECEDDLYARLAQAVIDRKSVV